MFLLQLYAATNEAFGHLVLNIDYGVYIVEIKWYSSSALIYSAEFLHGLEKLYSRGVKDVISDFMPLFTSCNIMGGNYSGVWNVQLHHFSVLWHICEYCD